MRDRSSTVGQSAVEFALALPVLLMLVFGVFEFGRLMQSWVTIQHAADEAARYATTGAGYDLGTGVREAQIVAVGRAAAVGMLIDDSAGPSASSHFRVAIRSSRSGPNPMEPDSAGSANDYVRVEVHYNHAPMTSLLGGFGNYIPLSAEALVINEHFARPRVNLGELPPTPMATWTPTLTHTPTPTSTPTATPTPP